MKTMINLIKLIVVSILFVFLWIFDAFICFLNRKSIKSMWKLETSVFEPVEDCNGDVIEFKLIKEGESSIKETLITIKNKYLS